MLGLSHIDSGGTPRLPYKRTGPLYLSTGLFPFSRERNKTDSEQARSGPTPKRTICRHTVRDQARALALEGGPPENSHVVRGPVRWGVMLGLSHIDSGGTPRLPYKRTGPLHLSTGLFPSSRGRNKTVRGQALSGPTPKRTIC